MSDLRSPDGPNGEKPTFWGQYATRMDPLEVQSGYGTYDFYAYDKNNNVVIATWTSAPMTFMAERAAYQSRLNNPKDPIVHVDVTRRDNRRDSNPGSLNAREPGRWLMTPNAIASAVR